MSKLSYSRYNYEVTLPDGSRAIYNLVSKQKLVLESPIKEFFEGILNIPESRLARKWCKAGFLADGDELTQLRLFSNASSAGCQQLGLTIAPTTGCNFRCPYCFETHEPVVMSREVQDKLVDSVKYFFTTFRPSQFSVSWYGGEPLLQPKIIEDLSRRFTALCDENKVEYSADIVTNGYLLTQELADMLSRCKVSKCQITLDGLKECNDKTRILADGGGSFDVITGNLRKLKLDFEVNVRCNLTQGNKQDFFGLKKLVEEIAQQSGNKLSCYGYPVDDLIAADKTALQEKPLSQQEWMDYVDLDSKLLSRFSCDLCYCGAHHLSSFVVAPDGNLYKCWNDITIPSRRVANLLEDGNVFLAQLRNEVGKKYLDVGDILEDEECRECRFLPLCKGGCPHNRVFLKKKNCLKSVASWIDKVILQQFTENKNKDEGVASDKTSC